MKYRHCRKKEDIFYRERGVELDVVEVNGRDITDYEEVNQKDCENRVKERKGSCRKMLGRDKV